MPDDAARLGMYDNLDAHLDQERVPIRNLQDAMSLVQTAEGGLQGISDILKGARGSHQASSETLTATDALRTRRIAQAMQAIDDIANTTEYNSVPLLATAQRGRRADRRRVRLDER